MDLSRLEHRNFRQDSWTIEQERHRERIRQRERHIDIETCEGKKEREIEREGQKETGTNIGISGRILETLKKRERDKETCKRDI